MRQMSQPLSEFGTQQNTPIQVVAHFGKNIRGRIIGVFPVTQSLILIINENCAPAIIRGPLSLLVLNPNSGTRRFLPSKDRFLAENQ